MPKMWYCSIRGNVTGPFTGSVIRQMAASGAIGPEDLVRSEGQEGRWYIAKSIKGLFDKGEQSVPHTAIVPDPKAAPADFGLIKHNCPDCDATLESPRAMAGQKDVCPSCHASVAVPQPRKRGLLVLLAVLGIGAALAMAGLIVVVIAIGRSGIIDPTLSALKSSAPGSYLSSGLGSPYSADYKIVSQNDVYAGIQATVKGPAARLAVILTDPKGKSEAQIIEKERMITNSHAVIVSMEDPQPGTWVLAVKTLDPEKVVWQKEIPLSLGEVTVKDVRWFLQPERWSGDKRDGLGAIQIALQKTGNLPITFRHVSFTVDGSKCDQEIRCIMVDQESVATIPVFGCPPTKKQKQNYERGHGTFESPPFEARFEPGERYLVKGQLFYGEDHKSVDFEKEFVGPPAKFSRVQEEGSP